MTYHRKREKKDRAYGISKRSIKDDYIDKQILAIHIAIVKKLLANPELVATTIEKIEKRRREGRMSYSAYITWVSIFEQYDDEATFTKGILENSQKMKRFRRETPLVGILTEEERKEAVEQDAISIISNMDSLFL